MFRSGEFAVAVVLLVKHLANSSDTISEPLLKCAPLLLLEAFHLLLVILSAYRCAQNFDIVKFKFFQLSLMFNYHTYK